MRNELLTFRDFFVYSHPIPGRNPIMKRILTPFLLSVGFAAAPLVAQNPIPNAGFNNWNTQTYEVPNHWMMIGKTSRDISKTLGYVNGVRLSNDVASGTVSFAMNVGSKYPDPLTGGFSMSGTTTPASIKINYNSEKLGNDTALVIVGFTQGTNTIPLVLQEFYILPDGTGAGDNSITVPLTYSNPTAGLVADSGFIYIASSLRRVAPNSNGSIAIYDISFPGGQTSTEGNLNLEGWGNLLVRKPNQWLTSLDAYEERVGKMNGLQEYILSSTDARSGLSALLKQRTINTNKGAEVIPAWMVTRDTNLSYADMGTPSFAVNQRYNSIRGFWKGTLLAGDRVSVMVNFFHADTLVGSGMFSQDSKSTVPGNYMMFAENIVWDSRFTLTPTKATVGVFLTDSTFQNASIAESQIYLEDLWLDINFATTKPLDKAVNGNIQCYPNPTKGNITIQSEAAIERVVVINTAGQVIYSNVPDHRTTEFTMDLSSIGNSQQAGLTVYFVRVETQQGTYTKAMVVQP
ncbi:MAG: Secretion system C-terminal sorting domain [Bacteroidota bacterium]